jgi:glycosyltransferase involved in cell wall biosynthesis
MNRLKICLVHNEYIHAGGEDAVFRAERALLTDAGHEVFEYREQNQRIANGNPMAIAFGTIWSERSRRKLGQLLRDTGSDVCHFHNTFPLISPSAYYACKRAGVATIQTLHNFRFVCPAATMFRDGAVCEDCVGHAVPRPAVAHACYRDSRVASAAVAGMLTVHRGLRTFDREVDFYIAPTDFTRRKLAAGGLPADKIVVKPHFLWDDPGIGRHQGGYALFVGRLTPEKGVPTLLRAWDQLKNVLPLKILGVGPLESAVRSASAEWAGQQPRECVFAMMRDATFLIFASEWYEVFGLTILEAFATGMPVICSRLGAS